MELLYHPVSPFSRKVFMFARELDLAGGIQLRQVVVAPVPYPGWSDDNTIVGAWNPAGKIPVLLIGQHDDIGAASKGEDTFGIFDSKSICEFLQELATSQRRTHGDCAPVLGRSALLDRWRREMIHACADSMLNAEVLIVYEEKIRREKGVLLEEWIEGQREKIRRGFVYLNAVVVRGTLAQIEAAERATMEQVAVAATLGFFDMRGFPWRGFVGKELTSWFSGWEKRESFLMTSAQMDWKTGAIVDSSGSFKSF